MTNDLTEARRLADEWSNSVIDLKRLLARAFKELDEECERLRKELIEETARVIAAEKGWNEDVCKLENRLQEGLEQRCEAIALYIRRLFGNIEKAQQDYRFLHIYRIAVGEAMECRARLAAAKRKRK